MYVWFYFWAVYSVLLIYKFVFLVMAFSLNYYSFVIYFEIRECDASSLVNLSLDFMVEKAIAPHSSVLAWRIPETREPGGLPSMGSHRARQD